MVSDRRRSLSRAVEGLGQHGLVGTKDESLLGLQDALRREFSAQARAQQEAVNKIDSLAGQEGGKGKEKEKGGGGGGKGGKVSVVYTNCSLQRALDEAVLHKFDRVVFSHKTFEFVEENNSKMMHCLLIEI